MNFRPAALALAASLVALFFVLFLMVHTRTPDKVALRRSRALERGYLAPKPPSACHIAVRSEIADSVKTVAQAMAKHFELDEMTGSSLHYLAHSALAARETFGESKYQQVQALNKAAGRAKHFVRCHWWLCNALFLRRWWSNWPRSW